MRIHEIRLAEEEDKRMNHFASRQLSIEKKQRNNQNIAAMNHKTKQFIVEREKQGYAKRIDEKIMEVERKRERSQQIKTHQRQFLQYKALTQAQQREQVSRQYAQKEEVRSKQIGEVMDKMRQLESVEQYLVEQLGKTQNTQQKALENLHSVVQLCNTKIDTAKTSGSMSVAARNPSITSIAPVMARNKKNTRSFTTKDTPM